MKTLVVYYSKQNHTRKVAEEIRNGLNCDIEELVDTQERKGILWYSRAYIDAIKEKSTILEELKNDPSDYDLVIIGTPVWRWISTPIRAYLTQNNDKLNDVAFFSTSGFGRYKSTFRVMRELSGKTPLAEIDIMRKDFNKGSYKSKVAEFVEKISNLNLKVKNET